MGGRYVYLIFYGTPIFFGGVCARYDSGIHFRNPLYGRCAVRSGRTRTVCTYVPASYGVVSNHLSPVTSCDPVNLSREILSVYVFTPSTLVHQQSLLPSRILSIQRLGW